MDTAGFYTFSATTEGNYKYGAYNKDITFLTDSLDISQSYTKSREIIDTTRFGTLENLKIVLKK